MHRMVSRRHRFAELVLELAKFGVVGLAGSVVDLGGAAYLHGAVGLGPLTAKAISVTAATVVTYLGSRFWTFRHRVNQALLREGTLFAALNLAAADVDVYRGDRCDPSVYIRRSHRASAPRGSHMQPTLRNCLARTGVPALADLVHRQRHWSPVREEESATWRS